MLTFAQIQTSSVASVAGKNVTSPDFLRYVNDAVRMLIEQGNGDARGWWGTVVLLSGTAYDGCFVWPANVISVLGVSTVRHNVPLANVWHSFIGGDYRGDQWVCQHYGRKATIEFDGQTCLFNPINNSPTQIAVMATSPSDNNVATITLYGLDANGNEVFDPTLNTRGITLQVGSAGNYITGATMLRVSDVAKTQTNGPLSLYAWSPLTGLGALLAQYGGGDVNPKFLYSRVCSPVVCPATIKALVKLGPVQMFNPNDICPIDSIDAIKSMVQAIRKRESGDAPAAMAFEQDAVKRLVEQVNSRFPKEQFQVSFMPWGRNAPRDNLQMI